MITAPTSFWAEAIKATPELESVVKAVESGTLRGAIVDGILYLSIDTFSGQIPVPRGITGAISMRGPCLPPLPTNGTFNIVFTRTTVELLIFDNAHLLIFLWIGTGISTVIGTFNNGTWARQEV